MTPEQLERKNQHRASLGLPPLNADGSDPVTPEQYKKLEEGESINAVKKPEPQKEENEEEDDEEGQDGKQQESNETPKVKAPVKQPEAAAPIQEPQPEPEITEETIRKWLKEKKGVEVNNFDDFKPRPVEKTPEQIEKERQIKLAKKNTFAIENGYYTKETYDQFVADSKDPLKVVLDAYVAAEREADPTLEESEIVEDFRNRYGLDADPATRAYKRGQQDLALHAEKIMKGKYPKMFDLDKDFDAHDSAYSAESLRRQRILDETPKYKNTVSSIIDKHRKTSLPMGKKDTDPKFEYEYSDEAVKAVEKLLLDPSFVQSQIERGYTEDGLDRVVRSVLNEVDQANIISNVSKKYHTAEVLKRDGERQGVKPKRDIDLKSQSDFRNQKATEMQKSLNMADAEGNLKSESELAELANRN